MDVAPLMGARRSWRAASRVVNLTGNRVGNDLPSVWRFMARPDPDSVLVPGGIIAGMGESVSDFEFTTCFEDPESQAMLTFAELLGVDPGELCGSGDRQGHPDHRPLRRERSLEGRGQRPHDPDADRADARDAGCDLGRRSVQQQRLPVRQRPQRLHALSVSHDRRARGRVLMVHATVEAGIPMSDPTNFYEYAFVFDADGDTTNNYQPAPAFPNDFFQDTIGGTRPSTTRRRAGR